MTEVPKERCLLDMPYEVSFEILRRLRKSKLFGISKMPSKFGNVARDTRLWKDVYISYEPGNERLAFEELYSGPSPVKVIDLSHTLVKSPVSFETDRVVKVTKLILTSIRANTVTIEAILAKYQCTKLHLDRIGVHSHSQAIDIAPEAFSKQTALEVLSLKGVQGAYYDEEAKSVIARDIVQWLITVLSKYCKHLKSLDLSGCDLSGLDSAFVENLPTTLEKLCLASWNCPGDSFFELLAKKLPNLKEIGLLPGEAKCPALLKFKFLETLLILSFPGEDIRYLYEYLIRFPALKKVHLDINIDGDEDYYAAERTREALRTKLEPHGIAIVRMIKFLEYPMDGNFWRVTRPRAM